ncbi:ABC transporter permease [Streptococcus merionis]|uniref:Membrane protein n=1 Tax=Streptococcus merionis TaxID=400065 RepID=A0A239SXA9_9STRE|nr:ABC transporter permease [Streptococcus merionis]SNU89966.1 membrane protein [Streptococcus merionis]
MKTKVISQSILSEFLKIIYNKATQIVLPIIIILQPMLAYMSAKQVLYVGLDATPETDSNLLEAIPPIEYIGFDTILIGLFAMIILGAVFGSLEFKKNSLRTTLLLQPNKMIFFKSKMLVSMLFIFFMSFISIFISIACSQYALGASGLNPIILNSKVWYFIILGTISWTLITMLSYFVAFLFKTSVAPLIFLIPQLYNIGEFLADRISIARFLPISLGQDLIATTPSRLTSVPAISIALLGLWVVLVATIGYYRFIRIDVGTK